MPITVYSTDNPHSSLNGDLSSYLLTSLDDEDSFVVLERSTGNRPNSDGTSSTQPQPPPHSYQPGTISEQFPVFNNMTNSMMTSRASHTTEAIGSMGLPFDTSHFSVSAEEIDKRLQDVLQENINLKENLYQTNLAMKQQLSTVKLLQDRASETQKNHQAKFEETKVLILKLGSEKNELEENNTCLTAELKTLKDDNTKLMESNVELKSEASKLHAEIDSLKKQASDSEKAMRLMAENENKSSLQPSFKEIELRELIDQLTKKLETAERARRQQEFDIEHLQAHVNRVKTELETSQGNLASVTRDLTTSQENLSRVTNELKKSQDDVARLTQELNKSQDNLAQIEKVNMSDEKFKSFASFNSPTSSFHFVKDKADFSLFKEEIMPRYYSLLNMMESSVGDAQTRKTLNDAIIELMKDSEMVCKELDRVKADCALKVSHSHDYDELQKKGFIERLDTLTAKLVEKEEALAIAERHLASLQEAVRLQNNEKKDDEEVQLLKSQVDILSNNIASKDEELNKSIELVKKLRTEVQTLTCIAEKSEVLQQQAQIYEADFEAERKSRESLVEEKDRLLEDMRHLQRRNQELIEELNRYHVASGEPNAPPLPNNSSTRATEHRQSSSARPQDDEIPPPTRFFCPNPECNMMFTTLEPLERHVISCMKLDN